MNEDVVLEIVGDGPYKTVLLDKINKLNLRDRVNITRYLEREELIQKYFDADLFILLSEAEAFGITVAEALVSGTPVIVSEKSALKEWIDGSSCFGLSDVEDKTELVGTINRLLGKKIGQVFVKSWDEVFDMLKKLYNEVLALD